jgi:hypothetical protein
MSEINTFGNETYFNKKATFFEGVEVSTGDLRVSDGTVVGDIVGDLTGNVTGDITGNITGNINGNVNGNLTGDVTGNVTGNLTGDVSGNVSGNVTGNLTGNVNSSGLSTFSGGIQANVSGNVTGNVTGNLTGNVNSSGISTFRVMTGITSVGIASAYIRSINDHGISGFRNLLRNGDFRIDTFNQGIGVGYSGTITTYFSDGWRSSNFTSTTEFRINHRQEQIGNNPASVAELPGFRYCNRTNIILDGPLITNHSSFIQGIERRDMDFLNWFTDKPVPVVLSFYAKADQVGNYPVSIRTGFGVSTTSYVMSYGIGVTNTWYKFEYLIPGPPVSLGTTMTANPQGGGAIVSFTHDWVSGLSTTTTDQWVIGDFVAGIGMTQLGRQGIGARLFITGVQLEAGTVPTEFERTPYAVELKRCQRYRYGWIANPSYTTGAIGITQSNTSTTSAPTWIYLPTAMRGQPTIRVSDPAHFSVQGAGTITNIDLTGSATTFDVDGHTVRITVTGTGFNASQTQLFRMGAAVDGRFLLISEL